MPLLNSIHTQTTLIPTYTILSLTALSAAVYLAKKRINAACPRIPASQLPRSSACRRLLLLEYNAGEKTRPHAAAAAAAWGLERGEGESSVFLSPWSPSSQQDCDAGDVNTDPVIKTHWIPSFAAIQVEVPIGLLSGYRPVGIGIGLAGDEEKDDSRRGGGEEDGEKGNGRDNTPKLAENFLAAFLDSRSRGFESWLIDDKAAVPQSNKPSSGFTPGSLLFGSNSRTGPGAYLLGIWARENGRKTAIGSALGSSEGGPLPAGQKGREGKSSVELPRDGPLPVTEFPLHPNTDPAEEKAGAAAGAVFYWSFPTRMVQAIDRAATRGIIPWRVMDGGFQEFVVEKTSEETARLTYICVECGRLCPDDTGAGELEGRKAWDFKKLPWLGYELHVLYAQWLLWNTVRRLKGGNRFF